MRSLTPMSAPTHDCLVIGAGIAGLGAARTLAQAGARVLVLDKGRGPGGRSSTRRVEHPTLGPIQFDHGAQFATAREPRFVALCAELERAGELARWQPRRIRWDAPGERGGGEGEVLYVGQSGANQWGRALAARLGAGGELRAGVAVSALLREGSDWWAVDSGGARHGPARAVLVTAPGPQARGLLEPHAPTLGAALLSIAYGPALAVMAAWDRTLELGFDLAQGDPRPNSRSAPSDAPPLALAAREASKPGRPPVEALVLHASAPWSEAHFGQDPAHTARALLAALGAKVGRDLPEPEHLDVHRWRYALVTQPLGEPHLESPKDGLFAAGDGCLGPRLELAFESGQSAAASILGRGFG